MRIKTMRQALARGGGPAATIPRKTTYGIRGNEKHNFLHEVVHR